MTTRKATNDKQISRLGKPADLLRHKFGKRCGAAVQLYLDAALSDNTRRSYNSDLKQFAAWGGVIPASPESVAAYVAHHALTLSCATLSRRVVAIGRAHTAQGIPSPTHSLLVKATLQGVRRKRGGTPRQVTALQKNDVVRLVTGLQGIPVSYFLVLPLAGVGLIEIAIARFWKIVRSLKEIFVLKTRFKRGLMPS